MLYMDVDFIIKNFLHNYDLLIEQFAYLFTDDEYKEYIKELNMESKDTKWERGSNFTNCLTDEYFELFIEKKNKLFSNKNDVLINALFGEKLSLKKIFNNRDESIKCVLWSYLHLMVLMVVMSKRKESTSPDEKNKLKERIKKLTKVIEENVPELEKSKVKAEKLNKSGMSDPKNIIKDMLGVEVNDDTNEMISDIVKSFETTLGGNGNPFAGILDISQKISSKYAGKINTGEIQLEKLMQGIQKTIPGMDGMFKGENGEGPEGEIKGMMNNLLGGMAGGLGGLGDVMGGKGGVGEMLGDMGGMGDMLGGMFNKEKESKKVIIDENFSTSKVDLGKIKDSKSMNIGKMLTVADSFGVIPGGKKKEGEDSNPLSGLGALLGGGGEGGGLGGLGALLGGGGGLGGLGALLGGMGKGTDSSNNKEMAGANSNIMELFNMMGNLKKADNKESADELKNKMDTFLEKNLGLDVKKINEDLEKIIKKDDN